MKFSASDGINAAIDIVRDTVPYCRNTAVSTLQGDELRQAAGQARAVNKDLAGGATVVITTTTIILILLVIIIIIALAK